MDDTAALFALLRQPAGTVVLTGGQTGVDQIALHVAVELGLPAFAVMPRGRRTDDVVPGPELAPGIPAAVHVHELESAEFRERTWTNARLSDGTLLWDAGGGGEGVEETRAACRAHGRPLLEVTAIATAELAPAAARDWALRNGVRVVQVAGSRARFMAPGAAAPLRREIAAVLAALEAPARANV